MKELEFWFDFGSNYSYLSMMRIGRLCANAGVRLHLKPFLLGPIFKTLGWETSPFVLQEAKGRYVWRDMQRECGKYGLGWTRPSVFPRNGLLAARVALHGDGAPWVLAFCEQIMLANFVHDRDIGAHAVIGGILTELGLDAADILAQANAESCKAALRARTLEAQARGIFGAPTFFVGDEMYWGNDRLDAACALAATVPPA